jgi:hypothetical protein
MFLIGVLTAQIHSAQRDQREASTPLQAEETQPANTTPDSSPQISTSRS